MASEKMLKEAGIAKLLVTMSVPVIMIMMVQVLYNMADVYFLGHTSDPMMVAAVSLSAPVFSAFSALNTLIGFGGCTAASIALGEGNKEKVRKLSSFVLYAGLLLGVLTGAGVLVFLDPLLDLLGANYQTAGYTAEYLRVMALGAPFAVTGGALANVIRADGDGKSAMISHLSGTMLNLVLDPVLISVLGWGVTGAAVATLLGNVTSFVILLFVMRKKDFFSLSWKDFTLDPSVSLRVLGLGFPMAASTLLMSFSSVFANRLFVRYGNEAVIAQGVAGKAGMMITMIVMGICMGMQPAISYNYGAGNDTRLKKILTGTGTASVLTALVLGAFFFFFREGFVQAFLEDRSLAGVGSRMVLGSLAAIPVTGIYQLCSVYLQSTGKVRSATITALLQKGIVYVPVLYVMNMLFGLDGLIYSTAVTDLISTVAAVGFCVTGKRRDPQITTI